MQIPSVVVLTSLQNGTGCRNGISAALHFNAVEIGAVGFVVVGVDHTAQHVSGFEIGELVGASSNGLEVAWRVAGCGAFVIFKDVLGNDHAGCADKGVSPEWRRLLVLDLDCVGIHLGDLDVLVGAIGVGRSCRVGGISSGKDHVIGCEGFAVVPLHVLFEFPSDGFAVFGNTTVGQ